MLLDCEEDLDMNIGLIGFGNMGRAHAWSIENLKYYYTPLPFSAKITGICTAHGKTAAQACARYGLGLYTNLSRK